MRTITQTMRADRLLPIMDIPEEMRQTKVNVIVIPIADDTAVYRAPPIAPASRAERIEKARSLFGILPSTISDDEIRTERLKRYEDRS